MQHGSFLAPPGLAYRHTSLNGSGDIAVYRTVLVVEAKAAASCPWWTIIVALFQQADTSQAAVS